MDRKHAVGDRVRHFRTGRVGTIVELHLPRWVDWRPDDYEGHANGAIRTDPSNLLADKEKGAGQ